MKRSLQLVGFWLLCSILASAQGSGGKFGIGGKAGIGGKFNPALSMTINQHPKTVTNTTLSCAVTVTSTTAGRLLIYASNIRYTGTGFANQMSLGTPTDNGTAQTWVSADNTVIDDAASSDGTLYAQKAYYVLSNAGGATTITGTWTATGLTGASQKTSCTVVEATPSITPIFYDTGNSFYNATSCTSCPGPAGLLNGTSDYIFQIATFPASAMTAISGAYTNLDTDNSANNIFAGWAGAVNQTSYAAPNWTESSNAQPNYMSFMAFGTNASPVLTANWFLDFSGLSNGVAPTNTTAGNSVHSGLLPSGADVSPMGTGVTGCTPTSGNQNLPQSLIVNGVTYTGASTMDLCGTTAVSGTAIGKIDFAFAGGQMAPASAMFGYSVKSSCLSNVECGALIRAITGGGNYTLPHISPLGDGKFCLEADGAGQSCTISEGGTYAPNTWYRINWTHPVGGGTARMTVCADGPGGAVLMTTTAVTNVNTKGIGGLEVGINGEEPTTAGITYEFRNVFMIPGTSLYSTSRCI